MDQEFNDFASAMQVALTKDGQNVPTANLPMGGRKHVNVAAAASATDYIRAREFITNVPIYMDAAAGDGSSSVSASATFYTTVSATHAPADGSRAFFRMPSYNVALATATAVFTLNTPTGSYTANIIADTGNPVMRNHLRPNAFYEVIYNSALAGYQLVNPCHLIEGEMVSPGGALATWQWNSRNAAGTEAAGPSNAAGHVNVNNAGYSHVIYVNTTASVSTSASSFKLTLFTSFNCLGGTDAAPKYGNLVGIQVGAVSEPIMCRTIIGSSSVDVIPFSASIGANTVVKFPPQTITWLASTSFF
jgi:hypothetical protein